MLIPPRCGLVIVKYPLLIDASISLWLTVAVPHVSVAGRVLWVDSK
jgi:hypothetical protein